ncbi:DNA polymerase I [Mycobacterium phage Phelemich]|uniref:DNA polymerase I n=2 Tax=Acadianvirus reprobate TaxID=1982903 RepID=S5YDR1_9CAUD|nr:DNA polymerase I [Mycobacterium phage Phelemich]YP_008409978.1 DNA polymerase I [Mycobacterium phage Reprobate]AGT12793.1 DNA polymerase I [Mycobacterium phage Reprobate]AGT13970.1 DNA polymerase I [Mycobacterium phage Phelemich]
MTATTTAVPRVPSRRTFDPVLQAYMNTGLDAIEACRTFPAGAQMAIDIETPGLDNAFTINCLTASWSRPDGRFEAILLDPARDTGQHAVAVDLLGRASRLILHNAPFDIPPLHHAGLISFDQINLVVDTLVLARFAMPDTMIRKGLEALAIRVLGYSDFKGGMERAFKAAGYKTIAAGYEGLDVDSPIYRQGAMGDTVVTLQLEPMLRGMCTEWAMDHPFAGYGATTTAEAQAQLGVQETTHRVMLRRSAKGLNVDRAYLDRYAEQVDVERNLAIAELAVHGLEGGSGKGAKLIEYLHARGELPEPWPRTPTKKLKATKDLLENLDHPLAAAQRKLAVIDKVMGYLDKVDRQASVTGRCHPQVGVLGASATGRMSYGLPELQQFPADARPVICDDGQGLTSIDWSQIEPVTMAAMARDVEFVASYERGDDLYEPIQRSCGLPMTKAGRDIAKIVLLATMYGLGIANLARKIGHTEESAMQIRRQMFNAMKRCEAWMSRVMDVATQTGVTITAAGRILPIDAGFEYKAVNYCIQGSAYDVLAHTIVEMERAGLGDALHLAMHDEVVVDTGVAEEVQRIMLTPPPFLIDWAQRVPILRTDRADMGHAWAKV